MVTPALASTASRSESPTLFAALLGSPCNVVLVSPHLFRPLTLSMTESLGMVCVSPKTILLLRQAREAARARGLHRRSRKDGFSAATRGVYCEHLGVCLRVLVTDLVGAKSVSRMVRHNPQMQLDVGITLADSRYLNAPPIPMAWLRLLAPFAPHPACAQTFLLWVEAQIHAWATDEDQRPLVLWGNDYGALAYMQTLCEDLVGTHPIPVTLHVVSPETNQVHFAARRLRGRPVLTVYSAEDTLVPEDPSPFRLPLFDRKRLVTQISDRDQNETAPPGVSSAVRLSDIARNYETIARRVSRFTLPLEPLEVALERAREQSVRQLANRLYDGGRARVDRTIGHDKATFLSRTQAPMCKTASAVAADDVFCIEL